MKKKLILFLLSTALLLFPTTNLYAADEDPTILPSAEENTTEDSIDNSEDSIDTLADDPKKDLPVTADGFSYLIQDDGSIAIMNYSGGLSAVTVPSHINGKTVTTLGNSCFSEKNMTVPLQSVTLPDTITTIYNYAFAFNESLTEIQLSDNITWIGASVFTNCGLTSLRLPKNLTVINDYLFMNCTNLKTVILPEKITAIRRSAFANCESLNKLTIPYGVKTIDDNAFAHCSGLTEVCLPESMTLIGSSSFYECNSLNLHVPKDSYAQKYAETKGYSYDTYENEPYADVIPGDWYYNSVNWTYAHQLMTGYANGNFGPADLLTRGQFALILYRYEGEPEVSSLPPFPDVEPGLYYSDAITWAKNAGVIGGYENGNFGPVDHMNREQLAAMMYRYANAKGYDTSAKTKLSAFPDASLVHPFAEEAMQWAAAEGLISGDGGMLNPQGNANRAVTATIIYRFINRFE